eukprot:gene17555-biopygen20386
MSGAGFRGRRDRTTGRERAGRAGGGRGGKKDAALLHRPAPRALKMLTGWVDGRCEGGQHGGWGATRAERWRANGPCGDGRPGCTWRPRPRAAATAHLAIAPQRGAPFREGGVGCGLAGDDKRHKMGTRNREAGWLEINMAEGSRVASTGGGRRWGKATPQSAGLRGYPRSFGHATPLSPSPPLAFRIPSVCSPFLCCFPLFVMSPTYKLGVGIVLTHWEWRAGV